MSKFILFLDLPHFSIAYHFQPQLIDKTCETSTRKYANFFDGLIITIKASSYHLSFLNE